MSARPIPFYPVLSPGHALGRSGDVERRLDRPGAVRVSHARAGLRLIARAIGSGNHVVVPDFLCVSAFEPFEAEGVAVERYRVGADLTPDLGDLSTRARRGASAVMMVSYFGLPQPVDAFRRICAETGALLIDDAAHSLLSDHEGKPYGTLGDAGVVSVRKTLATPDGAVVFGSLVHETDGLDPERPPSLRYTARTLARHADAVLRADVLGRRARARSGTLPDGDGPHERERAGWSRLTERVVRGARTAAERELRQRSYAAWPAVIDGAGAEPLVDGAPPEAGPSGFPVRISDEERFARRMDELRVEWIRWPDRPQNSAEFPRGVGVLPTHTVPDA